MSMTSTNDQKLGEQLESSDAALPALEGEVDVTYGVHPREQDVVGQILAENKRAVGATRDLEEFLSKIRKLQAEAEESAPVAPSASALPEPEMHRPEEVAANEPRSYGQRPSSQAYATSPEGMAAFKKSNSERAGASQNHAAAQAAARAKEAIERSAARPSTPSAGRSL
ncbi:hypothetical protein FY136_28770 (plasmid) [Agrobacterium tumefaciens]|uniref:hypothetical protein n=1 Tax=Agrobacterium tumefaciens TaxID=358 RepID=UPI0021D1A012|nr:hypothetical protein [Agrobacterium tumefaciens]UXT53257.1 hypothetical protein FY136_28770 [Agrobacterium tumefaciens]